MLFWTLLWVVDASAQAPEPDAAVVRERSVSVETDDRPVPTVLVTQYGRPAALCVAPCTLQLVAGPSIIDVVRVSERSSFALYVPPDAARLHVDLANHFDIVGNMGLVGSLAMSAIGFVSFAALRDDVGLYLGATCLALAGAFLIIGIVFHVLNRATAVRFETAGATVRF